jgi:YegS/Rv2252/BmrU family lipid kinase
MVNRNFCLLVNPYAGNTRTITVLRQVETALKNLSINFRTIITTDTEHAQKVAKEASLHGEYIAVLGGDGSINAVAETIVEHKGVLALLPSGRGNDFARMLNYPINAVDACQVLAHGKEGTMDVGQINQRIFITICSLGFDSVVNKIANRTTLIKGKSVYLYAGLRALIRWKPITFKVTIDDQEIIHKGHSVVIANTQYYGGGMRLAPQASAHDGLLDVVLIGEIPKHRMLANVPRIFKGTHVDEPGFNIIRGRQIKVEADPQYLLFADGDPICSPPATIQILPNALRVLLPKQWNHF